MIRMISQTFPGVVSRRGLQVRPIPSIRISIVWCFLALSSAVSRAAAAQATLVLDLGSLTAGSTTTEAVKPGTYAVRVDNRIPAKSYAVSVLVREVSIPTMPVEVRTAGIDEQCAQLKTLIMTYAGDSEAEVRKAVQSAVVSAGPGGACAQQAAAIHAAIAWSRYEWDRQVQLDVGQELVVTVTRKTADGNEKKWERVFTTGPRGQWHATYGFAAAFTRMGPKSGVFASRSVPYIESKGTAKVIAQRPDRGAADFVPLVAFHFMPTEREGDRVVPGLVAGLSFDGTNPLAMAGYGWTYQRNVNLSLGLIARKEGGLRSRYDVGDTIAADVTEDQLLDQHLRIRPFVALTFRLSTSPFSPKEKPKEVQQ